MDGIFLPFCMPDNFFLLDAKGFKFYLVAYSKYLCPCALVLCSRRQLHSNQYFAAFSSLVNFTLLQKQYFSESPIQGPLRLVFYSGQQEHKVFMALCNLSDYSLCSFQVVLFPTSVTSSHANRSLEGTLSRSLCPVCSLVLSCMLPSELHLLWPLWTPRSVSSTQGDLWALLCCSLPGLQPGSPLQT